MPRLMPTPMKATPRVPAVVHDEPVTNAITKHSSIIEIRNHFGENIISP